MKNSAKNNLSLISIIIPCRNEEKFIKKCLNSILEQKYPKNNLEILVVDGMSEDKTRKIVKEYSKKYFFNELPRSKLIGYHKDIIRSKLQEIKPLKIIKLLDNPKKFTSFAFNIGIKSSKGEIIMMAGAHSIYEKNYISKCAKYLKKYNTDNVGGVMKILPRKNSLTAKTIAICLSHPFGIGDSQFRQKLKKPKWADTVFGGCYKKEVFDKIGLFNENLFRSQDMEFNLRLKRAGGKILLCPDIISYYYARSTLKEFIKHNFSNGVWATYPLKFVKIPLSLRHYIPCIFVVSIMIAVILSLFYPLFLFLLGSIFFLYAGINLLASLQIAIKQKNPLYLFTMPLIFATLHISYGIGSVVGLIKILFPPYGITKTTRNNTL